eukprot:3636659-Rhodomonas_salina.1
MLFRFTLPAGAQREGPGRACEDQARALPERLPVHRVQEPPRRLSGVKAGYQSRGLHSGGPKRQVLLGSSRADGGNTHSIPPTVLRICSATLGTDAGYPLPGGQERDEPGQSTMRLAVVCYLWQYGVCMLLPLAVLMSEHCSSTPIPLSALTWEFGATRRSKLRSKLTLTQ